MFAQLRLSGFFWPFADGLDDWSCGLNRMDVSTCQGLQCNLTYTATETSRTKGNGQVYYECLKQISYDGLIFNAPDNYFYMPAGCEYNTDWDPKYPCFGGMEWNAFGSPCPPTCHFTPTEVRPLIGQSCHSHFELSTGVIGCLIEHLFPSPRNRNTARLSLSLDVNAQTLHPFGIEFLAA